MASVYPQKPENELIVCDPISIILYTLNHAVQSIGTQSPNNSEDRLTHCTHYFSIQVTLKFKQWPLAYH